MPSDKQTRIDTQNFSLTWHKDSAASTALGVGTQLQTSLLLLLGPSAASHAPLSALGCRAEAFFTDSA